MSASNSGKTCAKPLRPWDFAIFELQSQVENKMEASLGFTSHVYISAFLALRLERLFIDPKPAANVVGVAYPGYVKICTEVGNE
jgi:hypothetical protein